jgi:myo-inositol-1(or 4)-monophosphatase
VHKTGVVVDPGVTSADELSRIAQVLALEAGEILTAGRTRVRTQVDTKSTGTDMVTEIDRASETLIAARLLELRPLDSVLGEEGSDRSGTSGVRWVVDPLDGTTNYLYGFPAFAVSIAAEVDGVVVAGVVHDPVHGETFSAVLHGGATCNGVALAITGPPSLATALIGTGFSYHATQRAAQGEVVARVLPIVRDIRRAGAAALDVCWVAAGRLDAFYEHGLAPWDWAAASLIARESGARAEVRDAGLHVAAPPHLFADLVTLIEA